MLKFFVTDSVFLYKMFMYKCVLSIYTFEKNSKKEFCLEKQENGKSVLV